jgi:hypothetical protein
MDLSEENIHRKAIWRSDATTERNDGFDANCLSGEMQVMGFCLFSFSLDLSMQFIHHGDCMEFDSGSVSVCKGSC